MAESDLITKTGRLIVYTIITCVVIIVLPGLPPHIEPKVSEFSAERKLEGPLAPNNILDKAEDFIGKESAGGDSIVEDGDTIYFSIPGGYISKYSEKDGVQNIAQTGEPCDLTWEEKKCGLPLGMRMDRDKNLIICDPYQGVVKMNPQTGEKDKIVKIGQLVEGVPVNFPDDLDIGKDGSIYWSEPSNIDPADGFVETLSGIPSGRVMKTNPKTGETRVLLKDLAFANGMQLSPTEDFLLVGETLRQRVIRIYLKGEKKGKSEVFVDKLPGFPDNIRSNGKSGFYIPILLPRDKSMDVLGYYPTLRKLLIRVYALVRNGIFVLERFFPKNTYLGYANLYMRELVFAIGDPKAKSMIIETDINGNIIGSLHSDKQPLRMVTQAKVGDKYVYLGNAKFNVKRIKKTDIPSFAGAASNTTALPVTGPGIPMATSSAPSMRRR